MNYQNGEKFCRVCGDKALGFNFNGVACEACKGFFRRNALKQKDYRCRRNEKCEINKYTRKTCKRCRLKKCYEIGMKKELIWCYRDHHQHHSEKNVEFNEDNFSKESTMTTTYLSKSTTKLTDLNYYENTRLQEIQQAMSIFPDESKLECIGETTTILDTFNVPASYVKMYIIFCKSIEAYKSLSQDDQIIVFKKFYAEISVVRFSFIFDIEKDGFLAIEGKDENKVKFVNFKIFDIFKRPDLGNLFRNYAISLKSAMENDEKLQHLIIAWFLFKNRKNISCLEYISYNQTLYAHLIRRYLEMKYQDIIKADEKYSSLMEVLEQMDYICKTIEEVYLSFEVEKLAQIITEIYDMY